MILERPNRQEAAFAALEKAGQGDLIKHTLTIKFGKGEEKWAAKFMRDLAQRKKPLRVERKDAVAPQTLGAFVREQAAAAKEQGVPLKDYLGEAMFGLLGIYERRWTEVDLPKQV